ncbi:hypothetical protein [Mesorhizobium sp. M0047]|uniref:hypothetical protein n=1 Tax=unclassified Mesorhizobium TaxID=325217 RepID=UPI00333A1BC4
MFADTGLARPAGLVVPVPGPGASYTQCLREADAIQCRSETRFGKQRNGRAGFTRQLILVIRPADHAEQRGSGEPQTNAKQIGSQLILPAFKMVEYIHVFAQRLLQPEDIDDVTVDVGRCSLWVRRRRQNSRAMITFADWLKTAGPGNQPNHGRETAMPPGEARRHLY